MKDEDTVIYADKTALKSHPQKVLVDEILRLRELLDQCWDAAGLLGSNMTGKPAQAWETPSDLVDQIEDIASKADNCDESQEEAGRLRAGLEMLAQTRSVSGNAKPAFRSQLRTIDAILAGADVRDVAVVEAIAAGTWKPTEEGR